MIIKRDFSLILIATVIGFCLFLIFDLILLRPKENITERKPFPVIYFKEID